MSLFASLIPAEPLLCSLTLVTRNAGFTEDVEQAAEMALPELDNCDNHAVSLPLSQLHCGA